MKALRTPIVIGILGIAILLWLGFWQLDRLKWKEDWLARIDAAANAEPVAVTRVADLEALDDAAPLRVTGKIQVGHTDILSGTEHDGPGYRRVVPFMLEDGVILLEIGFLPSDAKQAEFTLPQEELTVIGNRYVPAKRGSFDEARNIWVGYDLTQMADYLGADNALMVIASEDIAEGFTAIPYELNLPNNHLQYAITWFLLALVWAAMSVYWGVMRMKSENRNS